MTAPRPTVLLVDGELHALSAMRMALEDEFGCITADDAAMQAAVIDAGIHQFLTRPWHPEQLPVAARNGARLLQLARDNGRLALEMRFAASAAQNRLDKRRAALRDGLEFETILRCPQSPMNATIEIARHFAGGTDRSAEGALTASGKPKGRTDQIEMRTLRENLTRHRSNKASVDLRAKLDRHGTNDPSGRVTEHEED